MSTVKDYYKILEVTKESSPEEIKKSYRKLARKYHPDLNPGDKSAEQKFKELNDAYAVLGDAEKKRMYDQFGAQGFDSMNRGGGPGGGGFGGFGGPGGGFSSRAGSAGAGGFDFDFGDIFSDIFSQGSRESQTAFRRGTDLAASVTVTMREAFDGVTRRMTFKREKPCASCNATGFAESSLCPSCRGTGRTNSSKGFFRVADQCSECGGTGRKVTKVCHDCGGAGKVYKTESLNVKIPAGVDSGSVVKLSGMGNAGMGGAPAGDLRLQVTVESHELFERDGDNLTLKLPITFAEAALGARIEVPTMDGSSVMTLPPGTQGGQRFKLSGKGFTRRAGGRGDLYVIAQIVVPKSLDDKAREALKTIEAQYDEAPRKGMMS